MIGVIYNQGTGGGGGIPMIDNMELDILSIEAAKCTNVSQSNGIKRVYKAGKNRVLALNTYNNKITVYQVDDTGITSSVENSITAEDMIVYNDNTLITFTSASGGTFKVWTINNNNTLTNTITYSISISTLYSGGAQIVLCNNQIILCYYNRQTGSFVDSCRFRRYVFDGTTFTQYGGDAPFFNGHSTHAYGFCEACSADSKTFGVVARINGEGFYYYCVAEIYDDGTYHEKVSKIVSASNDYQLKLYGAVNYNNTFYFACSPNSMYKQCALCEVGSSQLTVLDYNTYQGYQTSENPSNIALMGLNGNVVNINYCVYNSNSSGKQSFVIKTSYKL